MNVLKKFEGVLVQETNIPGRASGITWTREAIKGLLDYVNSLDRAILGEPGNDVVARLNKERTTEGDYCGQFSSVDMNTASHRVTNLREGEGGLLGDIEVFDNGVGKLLADNMEKDGVYFAARAAVTYGNTVGDLLRREVQSSSVYAFDHYPSQLAYPILSGHDGVMFAAVVPALPVPTIYGNTMEEVKKNIVLAIEQCFNLYQNHAEPFPGPTGLGEGEQLFYLPEQLVMKIRHYNKLFGIHIDPAARRIVTAYPVCRTEK